MQSTMIITRIEIGYLFSVLQRSIDHDPCSMSTTISEHVSNVECHL
jgi:hypothetical protein